MCSSIPPSDTHLLEMRFVNLDLGQCMLCCSVLYRRRVTRVEKSPGSYIRVVTPAGRVHELEQPVDGVTSLRW